MGNFFERLDRTAPKLFGGLLLILSITFSWLGKDSLFHNISPSSTEQVVLNMRGGSNSSSDPTQETVIVKTRKNRLQKINLITHLRYEKFFPDFDERVAYQEDREKVYKQAMIKRREALKLRQKEDFMRTKDEQDAIDYFAGAGFYYKHRDPSVSVEYLDENPLKVL